MIERAREILVNLEKGEYAEEGVPRIARRKNGRTPVNSSQLSLFGEDDPLRARLKALDVATMTPLEALNVLDELKRMN